MPSYLFLIGILISKVHVKQVHLMTIYSEHVVYCMIKHPAGMQIYIYIDIHIQEQL